MSTAPSNRQRNDGETTSGGLAVFLWVAAVLAAQLALIGWLAERLYSA